MVTGTRDERTNALWGRGGKLRVVVVAGLLGAVLAFPGLATAARAKQPRPHDTTPPETTLTAGPADGSTVFGNVTLAFSSTEPGSFECSVDRGRFESCDGGSLTIPTPAVGQHAFSVRAVDVARNVDASPATVTWTEGFTSTRNYAPGTLFAAAKAAPMQLFSVIVMTRNDRDARGLQAALSLAANPRHPHGHVDASYTAISGFSAQLPGWTVLWLSEEGAGVTGIIRDRRVRDPLPPESYDPVQVWQQAVGADRLWNAVVSAPTIAIIDSGVDGSKVADFGGRVLTHVNLGALGTKLDDYGHGTFVASIAAGSAPRYPGIAPRANLVDVRVIGADGSGATSDVINGIDWVLKHREEYGIKVVNLSLQSAKAGSFRFDPLDHAVESLWLNGITVVTSAGNNGNGAPLNMNFAPANDPFVITVGAADVNNTPDTADDSVAPWSAFGYTADGFAEPTLVAPGRRLIGAVPAGATLPVALPDRAVEPGYMTLSGTSLGAAVVSGVAAQLLALHPSWGPDQVKGALMLTAHAVQAQPGQAGVGEANVAEATSLKSPPNPNLALDRYVVKDASAPGGQSFDSASWVEAAKADPNWFLASFSSASWSDVSYLGASWVEASWVESSFVSASWSDAAQADAVLADASWGD